MPSRSRLRFRNGDIISKDHSWCPVCEGSGYDRYPCPKCKGEGCAYCVSMGEISETCWTCGGEGIVRRERITA